MPRDDGDWLILPMDEADLQLLRNRLPVPEHLKATLLDAEELLHLTHDCGLRQVEFIVYSNGAFALSTPPIRDIAAYVRAHFDVLPD
jgi:hypothetical protein